MYFQRTDEQILFQKIWSNACLQRLDNKQKHLLIFHVVCKNIKFDDVIMNNEIVPHRIVSIEGNKKYYSWVVWNCSYEFCISGFCFGGKGGGRVVGTICGEWNNRFTPSLNTHTHTDTIWTHTSKRRILQITNGCLQH